MDEQEQNERIEKLETSLEELTDSVNRALEEMPEEDEQEFVEVNIDDKNFIIHWIEDTEYSTISSYADAKAEFLTAALARDNTQGKTPVEHGDVMVIGTSCPWIALCVLVDSFDQREDPHAPEVAVSDEITLGGGTVVRREFVVWNACGEIADCACDGSVEELITGGIDENSPDTSWKVSLGACVWYNQLMSVSIYSHTTAGTNLLTKTRAFTLNKCGEIINIGKEVENQILIPCECADDDCPASADSCLASNGITDASTYTLTDNSTGLQGNAGGGPYTLTRPMGNCITWDHSASGWTLSRAFSGTASPCTTAGYLTYTDPADPFYGPINFYNNGTSSSIPGTYTSSSNGSVVIS